VLANIDAIEGLVNTTVQYELGSTTGLLVQQELGLPLVGTPGNPGWFEHTEGGVPWVDFSEAAAPSLFGTGITYPDGWPVHFTNSGVPYANFGETPIAGDPFGANGGTPGFVLPIDFVKLVFVTAVFGDDTIHPVDVFMETDRLTPTRPTGLSVFVSGNRLVPIRERAKNNTCDPWTQDIRGIQVSYVGLPSLLDPSNQLVLPAVLQEAAITWLAEYLAACSPGVTPAERATFAQAARFAERAIEELGYKLATVATPRSVRFYRR
jgi:hypothetical protein